MFKINVVKKQNIKFIRFFQILLLLLIIAVVIDILEIFKVSLVIGVLSFFLIFFMGDILKIILISSGMDRISDDDINKINDDFLNRNGFIYDHLHLGLFDSYLFSYEPILRFYKYSEINKLIYDYFSDDGVERYYLSVFTNEGLSITVAVSKEDFNKEVDEIVKHCKKVDKSIVFVDLVRNKNNR